MSAPLFLGVDAGGSTTVELLADSTGRALLDALVEGGVALDDETCTRVAQAEHPADLLLT